MALVIGVTCCASPPSSAIDVTTETPNINSPQTVPPGSGDFLFFHRFSVTGAKVLASPTFDLEIGFFRWLSVGAIYATSSDIDGNFNEFQPLLRFGLLAQQAGAPLDLGAIVAYNTASHSVDGAVNLARRIQWISLLGSVKAFSNGYARGGFTVAGSLGLQVHLTKFLALVGDVGGVLGAHNFSALNPASTMIAWSGGLAFNIPYSPHSMSLYVTNANTRTLEGASRGSGDLRAGFEFDIPFNSGARWASIFSPPPEPAAVGASTPQPSQAKPGTAKAEVAIRNNAFDPPTLSVHAGTTVTWTNRDTVPHTVTSDTKAFDSGLIMPGASWSRTFDQAGTFPFSCTVHPFMKGKITVE